MLPTMAKVRPLPPTPKRFIPAKVSMSGGNGSPAPETDAEHLARVEDALADIRRLLDVQLQRMGEMQALIDRLMGDRTRLSPPKVVP